MNFKDAEGSGRTNVQLSIPAFARKEEGLTERNCQDSCKSG
jgi:hypothetical protein